MNELLRVLPLQIIETDDRVILKRGQSSIAINDKNALIIIRVLQKALLQSPKTKDQLTSLFSAKSKKLIERFIDFLISKRFVLPVEDTDYSAGKNEEAQDIFYWHFNSHQSKVAEVLNEHPWAIIGINRLNKQLIQSLFFEGKYDFVVVDDPSLRNVSFYDDNHQITDEFWEDFRITIVSEDEFRKDHQDIGFIIASSEFGSFYLLETWNEFAIDQDLPFYPILLQNMVGYAGPLVIPREEACLSCLKIRQNSASNDFEQKRITERFAFEGQTVVSYHNSMLRVLAEVSAFDIIKFKSNIQWDVGSFREIDLLAGTMERRTLIKAPRCPACSRLKERPQVNIYKKLTSDEAWEEIEQTVGHHE